MHFVVRDKDTKPGFCAVNRSPFSIVLVLRRRVFSFLLLGIDADLDVLPLVERIGMLQEDKSTMKEEKGTFSAVLDGAESDIMCHSCTSKAKQGESPHDAWPMTVRQSGAICSVELIEMPMRGSCRHMSRQSLCALRQGRCSNLLSLG